MNQVHYLVVIDMQNDFIDGSLGTKEAELIVDRVVSKIHDHNGPILYTRDTHQPDYLETAEGRHLPVVHCVEGTHGWQLNDAVAAALDDAAKRTHQTVRCFDKPTFGSMELAQSVRTLSEAEPIAEIELVGLCTDICVISNALMLKAACPEIPVSVDASCCAGVTPQSHENALNAMRMCQIEIKGV